MVNSKPVKVLEKDGLRKAISVQDMLHEKRLHDQN